MKEFKTKIEINKTFCNKQEACWKLMEYVVYIKNSYGLKTLGILDDGEYMDINPIHQEYGFTFDLFFDKIRFCAEFKNDKYFLDLSFFNVDIDFVRDVILSTEQYKWEK